jgi:large repetitive protein
MIHSFRRVIPSFLFSQRAVILVSFLIFQVFQVQAQCDPNSPYDKIVSGYHQSIALKSDGGFAVWGQAMAANGTSDVLTPIDLNVANYPNLVGTPLKATIGGAGGGTAEQAILLTSDGLYAWGSEGDVLANALTASGAFAKVTVSAFDALTTNASTGLPTGVAPGDVVSMSASNQTLVILTRSGNVWVLSQMSTNLYGNAAGSLAVNKWQKVKTNVSTDLANITAVRVQVSSATYNAFIALSSTGTVYTWGSSVYLGDRNGPVAKNYATAMTIPVEFTSSNLPKIIGVTGGTKNVGATNNSFYLLSAAGTLYVLGENGQRQLGTFDQVDALTWTQAERVNGTPFTNISFISVQEHDDSAPGVSAITSSGDLYTWGENEGLMLGRTTDGTFYDPAFPFGFTSGTDKALSSELGGHTLVYLKEGTTQFCYVGHKTNGSMGDGVSSSSFISTFDCANTPSLSICGSVPVAGSTTTSTISASIRSILANGTTTSTITIQLKTSAGVNLTSSGGNVAVFTTAGTLGTVVNNNDGTYTVILTSASSAATAAITYTLNGSSGTNTESVAFTTISSTPTITSTGSLGAFTACAGTVSAEQNFSVGATDLTTDLIVTAPTGFELSLSSGGTFSASLTLSPSSGTVSSTTIYIRLKSNASSASALDVALSSTGATSVNVATGISTVNVLPTVTGTTDGARSGTGTVNLSGTASSGATLDWYADPTGGSVISGGSGVLTFTTPSISATTIYYAQARNTTSGCISTARTPVTATVNTSLAAGSIGGTQSICSGSTPTTLTSSTAASGGTGAQTYQWQVSTDNTSFTDISSANAVTYSPGALTQTTYYRRGVSTGIDAVIYTSSVAVTVSPTSVAGTISAGSATLCYNESTLLSLTGSTGNIQWQSSPDGTSWTDIPTATNATYNTGNLTTTTRYQAVVTSGACSAATTALAQIITVNPEIIISGTTSISRAITSQLSSTGTPATLNAWVSSDITVATISSTGLVTPLNDGTTNITYTQSNGCSKTILFTVLTTDTDGDGVPDDKETLDGTDPNDGCSFKPASRILTPSDSWKSQDCDNDGISNFMECNLSNFLLDTDGDGVPNFLDGDSDNDGIPDNVERNVDSDGDRIADYQDLDSDNDGIGDTFEKGSNGFKPVDTDKDGRLDYLDLDSDGDGLLDAWELLDVYAPGQDKDLNGIADVNGAIVDKNGNGWLDILENYRPTDTDKDGKPDYLDLDSDNDNISDTIEGTKDTDNDRRVNFRDADSDGDGIGDIVEGQTDTDKDGVANYLDLDSDGDGILDSLEGVNRCPTCKEGVDNAPDGWEDSSQFPASGKWVLDTDKDGTPDYLDLDSDNDGIPDAVEAGAMPTNPADTDKDSIYDFRDLDSDNDGLSDAQEAGKNPATPLDTDKDGMPDYQDLDSDNDGIPDAVEAGKNPATPADTDKDGTPDYQDLDSDNDGIPDVVEAGKDPANPADTDKDGTPDYQDLDSDNDGIPDAVEAGKNPATPVDTDKDGTPDYQDLDSDNDGIPDAVEAGKNPATPLDTDKDGTPDYQDLDSDNDGIPDAVEAGKNPATPVDTDKDGTPDYQDLDSDNDGIPDAIEAGKDPSIPVDTDKDGMPDYQDLDSDNDGISDKIEAGADAKNPLDTDKDGIYDFRELDSDNDGLADKLEAGSNPNNPVDTDGDGLPDYRDLESDGDGIPDKIEAGANPASPLDTDGDGTFDFRDLDSDGDGLSDRTEAGANPNAPVDTDGDGKPDFQDIDSDGDGLLDRLEDDVNFGALPDCDRDGIPNRIDKDVCETYLTQGFSPNGDGVNDTFVIPGLAGMGNNKLTVFNRWGNIVFEADNYKNDWGGKTNNAFDPLASDGLLPDGVYYYVIDFNGSRPAMSNYLFINRLAK